MDFKVESILFYYSLEKNSHLCKKVRQIQTVVYLSTIMNWSIQLPNFLFESTLSIWRVWRCSDLGMLTSSTIVEQTVVFMFDLVNKLRANTILWFTCPMA